MLRRSFGGINNYLFTALCIELHNIVFISRYTYRYIYCRYSRLYMAFIFTVPRRFVCFYINRFIYCTCEYMYGHNLHICSILKLNIKLNNHTLFRLDRNKIKLLILKYKNLVQCVYFRKKDGVNWRTQGSFHPSARK